MPRQTRITIGGALRFNYNLSLEGQKNAEVILDMMFFINAKAKYKGIKLMQNIVCTEGFGGGMLKQGWLMISILKMKFK
jgi:hypothetical protein